MRKVKCLLLIVIIFSFMLNMVSFSASTQNESGIMSAQQFKKACPIGLGFQSFERKQLFGSIYEYSIIFSTGDGEYDKIRIHRVVKEKAPYIPIKTENAVMMIHGDTANFTTTFLPVSGQNADSKSLAAYLAKNNIDVWGIDLRWTFIPDDVTDFAFMKDWDTELHLGDIELSVKFARLFRILSGCMNSKILMLGHSRGAFYSFAYANMETQKPAILRDIEGIIPMDLIIKLSDENEDLKQAALTRYQNLKRQYDEGVYYDNEGASLKYVALMAKTAPDEMSAIIPYLTNKQVAAFLLSATYATFEPPLEPFTPYYHLNAGTFDENGMPTGFQFTSLDYLIDIALRTPSYQSIGEMLDCEAIISEAVDLPYDDYLEDINIPVFYVGAAGGEGKYGQHILSLIGSDDKDSLILELHPPEYSMLDYGHTDLIWADNAVSLVWEPILSWINVH